MISAAPGSSVARHAAAALNSRRCRGRPRFPLAVWVIRDVKGLRGHAHSTSCPAHDACVASPGGVAAIDAVIGASRAIIALIVLVLVQLVVAQSINLFPRVVAIDFYQYWGVAAARRLSWNLWAVRIGTLSSTTPC